MPIKLKRGLPPNRPLNKMKWRSIKTQPTSDDDGHSEQYQVVFIIFQNTAPSIMIMVGGKTIDLYNDKYEKILATK